MALYHALLLGLLLVAGGFAVGVMWFALASINRNEEDAMQYVAKDACPFCVTPGTPLGMFGDGKWSYMCPRCKYEYLENEVNEEVTQ